MKNYEYVTHQLGIQLSEAEAKTEKGAAKIKQSIETVMAQYNEMGYEFHSQISLPVTVNPGCLGGLAGAKAAQVEVPVLVFRREIPESDMV